MGEQTAEEQEIKEQATKEQAADGVKAGGIEDANKEAGQTSPLGADQTNLINAEIMEKLQRALAEFDNFRKRTMKEKASMYDDGIRDAVEKLLSVADNFERALLSADDKDGSFYKGVDMIYRQLIAAFEAIGVETLPGEGEPFDPNMHNAVVHVEDEAFGENIVAAVLQKGYKYKDKVIRHAAVKVAN
jgi:molecular chaperone GrpE